MSFKEDDDVAIDAFVKKVVLQKLATQNKIIPSNKTQHKAPKHKFERGDNGSCNTRQNMIKQNKKDFFTKQHHK